MCRVHCHKHGVDIVYTSFAWCREGVYWMGTPPGVVPHDDSERAGDTHTDATPPLGGGEKGCATQEGIDLPHTAASPAQLLNKPCTPWCVTVPEEVVGSAVTGRLQQYRRGTGQRQGSNHRFGNRPPLLAVGRTHALCEECWSVIIMRSIGNYSPQSETQPKGFRGGPK